MTAERRGQRDGAGRDYDQVAVRYDRGRALSVEGLEGWRAALAAWLPPPSGLPVLDFGAGTGLFATAIATGSTSGVVAVEPSAGMRRQARRARTHARVAWVGGQAERLPLRDGCCGGAWLSTVIHLGDLPGCAWSSAGSYRRAARC